LKGRFREKSTKTRIETWCWWKHQQHFFTVLEKNPPKQGLKLLYCPDNIAVAVLF